jgi:Uncharacterized protein conserved in bacteria (DUF2188)
MRDFPAIREAPSGGCGTGRFRFSIARGPTQAVRQFPQMPGLPRKKTRLAGDRPQTEAPQSGLTPWPIRCRRWGTQSPSLTVQNYHLVPDGDHWTLTKEGSDRAVGTFNSRGEAVEHSAALLNGREGSLKIHKSDGSIDEERTYPRAADAARSKG